MQGEQELARGVLEATCLASVFFDVMRCLGFGGPRASYALRRSLAGPDTIRSHGLVSKSVSNPDLRRLLYQKPFL